MHSVHSLLADIFRSRPIFRKTKAIIELDPWLSSSGRLRTFIRKTAEQALASNWGAIYSFVLGESGSMKAYKFRSSANIEFALDILINRRLYCADWRQLNDPMEGMFAFSSRGEEPRAQRIVKGIGEAKSRYKVCSLAADFQSHLLWAHYAGGFDGLAIEIDLPDNDPSVKRVDYRGVFAFLDMDEVVTEDDAARKILFSKYDEWSYEQEIRVLHWDAYYPLDRPIRRVIAGPRMNRALFDTLHLVCDRENIRFFRAGIGDEGIDADTVPPLTRRVKSALRSARDREAT
jgi:hypothetical protein